MSGDDSKRFYKVVFVLGAAVERNKSDEFVIATLDRGLPQLAEWRIDAAKRLYKLGMVDKFITVGGEEKTLTGEKIYRPEVMRNLMTCGQGSIPRNKVEFLHDDIGSTRGNIKEINNYIRSFHLTEQDCAFLTNYYHIPRSMLFFEEAGMLLRPLAAESFLLGRVQEILAGYEYISGSGFVARLVSELSGMYDLEMGRYKI